MNREKELLQRVINAVGQSEIKVWKELINEIKAELAKPEQEAFAWFDDETADVWVDPVKPDKVGYEIPLYTSTTQQKPLSEEEIKRIRIQIPSSIGSLDFARAIEKARGIE